MPNKVLISQGSLISGVFAAVLVLCSVLAPSTPLRAGTCTPQSATITYQADDYFVFYLNGNEVVNGTAFDQGNPPAVVSIPIGYFAAPGASNYFAVEDKNSEAFQLGCDWLISITCSDGSMSYITDADSSYTMYDDTTGSSPPLTDGLYNWYQPQWVDTGNQFNQTPVDVADPTTFWFNPHTLTNPATGAALPILSHSASGDQYDYPASSTVGTDEDLYFRESVDLVEQPSPTASPSPTPTGTPYPPGCGPPVFQGGATLLDGQPGNSAGAKTYNYTVPSTTSDALVLVEVEEPTSGEDVSSMTFGGAPVPLWESQTMAGSASGTWAIYAMTTASLAAGSTPLVVTFNNTDNTNDIIQIYLISNAQSSPFGVSGLSTETGSGNTVFTKTSPPLDGSGSLLMDFMVNNQNIASEGMTSTGVGQTATGVNASVSGYATWSDSMTAGGAGSTQGMSYDWPSPSGQTLDTWQVEIKANACASPTVTNTNTPLQTPTDSPTATDTPTQTSTATDSPTYTATDTATDSPTATPTDTQTDTATDSPTATPTDTQSDTATESDTATGTPTYTDTPTSSDTASDTPTSTQTSTFSMTQTLTDTPTDTATSTATPTFTQSFTFTLTDTPSATPTLTDTLTSTDTFTDSPTVTQTSTFTDSPTITNTPVPVPVSLKVLVYSSSGELVDVLFEGGAMNIPSSVAVGTNPVLAGVQSVIVTLNTELSNGAGTLAWEGENSNGQLVSSGGYYIQLSYENNFGQTTTFNEPVQVIDPQTTGNSLNIFNSAGEIVWTAPVPTAGSGNGTLSLSSDVVLMALDSKTGQLITPLNITVGTNPPVAWDGLNLEGQPVAAGDYTVQFTDVQPLGEPLVVNKTVKVVSSSVGHASAAVTVFPDPWNGTGPLEAAYTPAVGDYGAGAIYTLSGQKVAEASDPGDSGTLVFSPGRLSPGIYLLEFRQMNAASTIVRSITKFAVVH
ncbi:MAG TPA: hypothetical protein VK914_11290 [bacterium]|nr:hypothetical protein [bacterium]